MFLSPQFGGIYSTLSVLKAEMNSYEYIPSLAAIKTQYRKDINNLEL